MHLLRLATKQKFLGQKVGLINHNEGHAYNNLNQYHQDYDIKQIEENFSLKTSRGCYL